MELGIHLYTFIFLAILAISYLLFITLKHVLSKKKRTKVREKVNKESLFIDKLEIYMTQEKPYENPELSRYDLAKALKVHPDYLTNTLNKKLGMNFREYINRYRVEEVKNLINNGLRREHTLEAIGYEAGFSSRSTFFRVFRNIEGVTPSEYSNTVRRITK